MQFRTIRNGFIQLCCALLCFAPGLTSAENTPDLSKEIRAHIEENQYPEWATDLNWTNLKAFYQARNYRPAWLDSEASKARAKLLRDTLIFADLEGLDPTEYHIEAIRYLWRAKRNISRARLDILLTDAFFRYSVEVRAGYQYPRIVDNYWYLQPSKVRPVSLLSKALEKEDFATFLADLAPAHPGYRRLRDKLAEYRALAQLHPQWSPVTGTTTLRLGSRGPDVAALRTRLQEENFNSGETINPDLFDSELARAVKQFQQQYGQEPDGLVGPATRRALNTPLNDRINQIQQNMERWRWLPRNLGERYVLVNMAGYHLNLVENGETSLEMRVIIGKPYKATPAFKNTIKYLELNPRWNIPSRIGREDILPKVQRDPSYLQSQQLRILESWRKDAAEIDPSTIDWAAQTADNFPYKFQQLPGLQNSLGSIKFMFPNSWNVYLHDTPRRELFAKRVRTFSSGCIRLEQPVLLAEKLLGNSEQWSAKQLQDIIASEQTQRIHLPNPVPIYLLYWTAWVDPDGKLHFRDDIYQRNEKIATANDATQQNS